MVSPTVHLDREGREMSNELSLGGCTKLKMSPWEELKEIFILSGSRRRVLLFINDGIYSGGEGSFNNWVMAGRYRTVSL
jgi:hypothetical protein